jgi:hypothetical protein
VRDLGGPEEKGKEWVNKTVIGVEYIRSYLSKVEKTFGIPKIYLQDRSRVYIMRRETQKHVGGSG